MSDLLSGVTPDKIFIGSDHAGFVLKSELLKKISNLKWQDMGPADDQSVDYPDYADRVVNAMAEFGVSRRRPVNILRCLESGSVATLYGRKKLVFVVVNDEELEGVDAKTEFSKGVVTITCRRSVRNRGVAV